MTPVLFDLDGTLIDSLGGITEAANATLAEWDVAPIGPDLTVGFVGRGEKVFVQRMIAATALPEGEEAAILPRFVEHYKIAARNTPLMPGARAALDRLHAQGVALGLVTNKPRAPLGPTLEAAGLTQDFQVVLAGDDLPRRKPDPDPIFEAMRVLGAERCLYVGDSDIDAETALAAGQPFVLYTEGIRTVPVEDIPHTEKFSDFADLDAIIARIDEGWSAGRVGL
ncbi:HAD-IA family hydrolase [Alphaproteobacteria bacterium GH1-50]|uniref:phosphoglycolate phosphatase n=1 Tax=Kangsaoukella pontilimi TaxID=2691042 RepID=A0A7C9MDM6_9RHOB|nr:HAD-IA family hydrolase [Kangsaoukella pontilimi]MXQ07752.1 HAD-IA family hydrolase [Kangsaoukella pontilimi]